MKTMLLMSAVLLFLATNSFAAIAAEDDSTSLNNLVRELINVEGRNLAGRKEVVFTNPIRGWCFFSISGEATIRLDNEKEPFIVGNASSKSAEAMRELPSGSHTLHISGQPDELIVRAVPALQHAFYGSGDAWNFCHGQNDDWGFLNKYVLPNINVIISGSNSQGSHIKEWTSLGRSWITTATVPKGGQENVTADEAYEFWTSSLGLTESLMDGIIVDEFPGGDQPKYDEYRKAVERIYSNPKFKGKTFSPYSCGGGGILSGYSGTDRCQEFARACMAGGGYVCIERYLIEQPSRQAAESYIHKELISGWNMPRFEKDFPGAARQTVMVLGCMSAVGESLNVDPGVDFKVYMDMQMQTLATDPAFAGLGGIQQYHTGYADEETVRWTSRLFRHYAIEGNRNLLSEELGFRYQLDHITNPDFADGTSGWAVQPAETNSIVSGEYPQYGYLQFRCSTDGTGDKFLLMKRNDRKPNVISQEIRNLTPGKLYSLKLVTGDHRDLVELRSESKSHAISIDIDNVEMRSGEKNSFQEIFPSHYARPVGEFKGEHAYYMNFHWRVFRVTGNSAKLTISDWKSQSESGGPAGQELMFNFVEIQPYFEE